MADEEQGTQTVPPTPLRPGECEPREFARHRGRRAIRAVVIVMAVSAILNAYMGFAGATREDAPNAACVMVFLAEGVLLGLLATRRPAVLWVVAVYSVAKLGLAAYLLWRTYGFLDLAVTDMFSPFALITNGVLAVVVLAAAMVSWRDARNG